MSPGFPRSQRHGGGVAAPEAGTYAGSGLSEKLEVLASWIGPSASFVLADGGEIAGCALALPRLRFPDLVRADTRSFTSTHLHLHDLVVAPGRRRRGPGGLLPNHLTTEARRQACAVGRPARQCRSSPWATAPVSGRRTASSGIPGSCCRPPTARERRPWPGLCERKAPHLNSPSPTARNECDGALRKQ
ncbi:GNAT family N-acetyltransferase [Streptomyces sp. NPDC057433]|uniref:GNAT family N-acetyltransferase n=1 Tax=Streptomyces sp. NPDC057433 TaxID=3346132 RepID=UPI00368397FC